MRRYHALDALRAAMMFLGIYLHAAVAYSPNGGWLWKQAEQTRLLDWSTSAIHVFRMPIFYAMAGFFTALLIARYGSRRAAWNRFLRIVVPFVVGWMVVWPLSMFLAGLGHFGLERTLAGFASGLVFAYVIPLHLWFLEYLILLYLLAAVAVALVPLLLSEGVRQATLRAFRAIVLSPWAPLALAVPSFAAQLLMPDPWIEDPPGFVPVFRIVAVYAVPFAVGWLLFLQSDLLETIARRAWLYAALAVVASVAYRYSYGLPLDRAVLFYLIRGVHAAAEWLLILGVAGLFLRYLSDHSPYRRYLCDSSYFLYIAHMPVILAFQLLLKDVPLPPLAKFAITLAGTVAVLLPVYRFGVRPTFIGAILNGRRYPSTIGPVVEGGPQLEDRRAQDAVH
ncbi:MAG: acyltransferase family protein [Reyranella sp.]|uniref:acyltransferase family protein n=1 Tax=Reyranella sp. TaxID=1929291 RepID=UPI001AC0C024|nr:acyltransferase family protein [Reyranella sp.]MBN9090173.1 acyltransferase family protein [Reyranella sp.]